MDRAEMASLRRISAARSSDVFAQRRKGLSVIDRVAHELLVHPDMAGIMTTKQMRILLRYKAGVKELNGLSDHILQAVNMLLKVRILEDVQQDIGESAAEGDSPLTLAVRRRFNMRKTPVPESKTKKRGRKLYTVQKRSWTAIEAEGASTVAVVKRLLLSPADFV